MCGEFAGANVGGRNEAISLIDRKMPPKAFDSVGKHSNTETEIYDEKLFFAFNIFSKRFVTVCSVPSLGDRHHSLGVRRLLRQKKAFSPQRGDWCKTGSVKHHHRHYHHIIIASVVFVRCNKIQSSSTTLLRGERCKTGNGKHHPRHHCGQHRHYHRNHNSHYSCHHRRRIELFMSMQSSS